jgi:hypothetical protein
MIGVHSPALFSRQTIVLEPIGMNVHGFPDLSPAFVAYLLVPAHANRLGGC